MHVWLALSNVCYRRVARSVVRLQAIAGHNSFEKIHTDHHCSKAEINECIFASSMKYVFFIPHLILHAVVDQSPGNRIKSKTETE